MKLKNHLLEALRWAAEKPCHRSNCGELCLCGACHAREALRRISPYDAAIAALHRKHAKRWR